MKKVEVRIPTHEHSLDGKHFIECPDSGNIRTVRMTKRRTHFKCPACGQVFSIMENLHTIEKESEPKCINSERGYICSVSGLPLSSERDTVYCPYNCYGCDYTGRVFKERARQDQGFVPGFYVDTTPVTDNAGQQKRRIPPLTMLDSLGCKGIVIKEDAKLDSPRIERIADFEHGGELHKIKPIGYDLYDIDHDKFWLYHKYTNLVTFDEEEQWFRKDEEPKHVFCLVDKETKKTYILPQRDKNVFGFTFKRGVLYRYIPQIGVRLADAQAFRDNTKYIAYKVKEIVRNTVTNKNEETYGYLVPEDKIDEFFSLTRRSTRIISSVPYSGISSYDKKDVWAVNNAKGEVPMLEAIVDDNIYHKYLELIELDEIFEGNITEFELLDPEEIQTERSETWTLDKRIAHAFGKMLVPDFNENFTDFNHRPWTDKDYTDIEDLYKSIKQFIDQYCQGLSGKTEDVLHHLYCDAVDPNNVEFTRWIDDFDGGKENKEYYKYSNSDLVQAFKSKHVFNLAHITSEENIQAIQELFTLGTQHPSYGNPLKSGKAQEVAFDYQNPYDDYDDFTLHRNLGELLKEDPDIQTIKVWGPKPQNQWSDKDHERHAQGKQVKEIKTIIMGVNVSEDDMITKHCLNTINNEYTPLPLKNISVAGSRVMPTLIRTRYIKNDDVYGSGYFTPAVHVWKGYYDKHDIKVVVARTAKGGDCSAIIAALEINEELANRLQAGIITAEEYKEQSIKIVTILHGWYASATFNNPGLMSILHKVLHYGGYVLCNEPYRKKDVTTVRYPKKIETHTSVMKVPVTINNYTNVSNTLGFTHDISFKTTTAKNDISNPIYTYFDHRIERTNKLLAALSDELVVLCRSEYSGTTNTINFALELGKKVIEITSPSREIPKEFRTEVLDTEAALKMYYRFCRLSENNPIPRGHSIPRPKVKEDKPQRRYARFHGPQIKTKFIYYETAYIPMQTLDDKCFDLWALFKPQQYNVKGINALTSLRGKKYQHIEKIPYIAVSSYVNKGRFNFSDLFDNIHQMSNYHERWYKYIPYIPMIHMKRNLIFNNKKFDVAELFNQDVYGVKTVRFPLHDNMIPYIKMAYYTDVTRCNVWEFLK